MPRKNDEEYMELWHKYMQTRIDYYTLKRERNIWRRAFYTASAILFAITVVLLVLVGSKIINLYF